MREHKEKHEAARVATVTVEQQRADGNRYLGAGLGIGAFGVASGLLLGAVCPLCIVATPALLGAGVYKRICAQRSAAAAEHREEGAAPVGDFASKRGESA